MKKLVAVALAAVFLAGCASLGTAQTDVGKAYGATLAAVDAASLAADAAVKSGLTTKAEDAEIAKVAGQISAGLVIAKTAYATADATTLASAEANLTTLVAQLAAATPK